MVKFYFEFMQLYNSFKTNTFNVQLNNQLKELIWNPKLEHIVFQVAQMILTKIWCSYSHSNTYFLLTAAVCQ